MSDRVITLAEDIVALDARPVAEHPPVLDALHRALVEELDALAGVGAAGPAARRQI